MNEMEKKVEEGHIPPIETMLNVYLIVWLFFYFVKIYFFIFYFILIIFVFNNKVMGEKTWLQSSGKEEND